jgi:hypothetical protein
VDSTSAHVNTLIEPDADLSDLTETDEPQSPQAFVEQIDSFS